MCSVKVADCKCWPLLHHCCPRTTTVASPALQGELLTHSFVALIHKRHHNHSNHSKWPCLSVNLPHPLFQIAPVENDDSYDELKRDAKTCLSLMSQGLLYTEQIPMVLSALQEVSHLAALAPILACITHDLAFYRPALCYNLSAQ